MNGILAVASTLAESKDSKSSILRSLFNFLEHVTTLVYWIEIAKASPAFEPSNPDLPMNMKVRELKKNGFLSSKAAKFINETSAARNQFAHTILPLSNIYLADVSLEEWAREDLQRLETQFGEELTELWDIFEKGQEAQLNFSTLEILEPTLFEH